MKSITCNTYYLVSLFFILLSSTSQILAQILTDDYHFNVVPTQYLDFPLTKKDFQQWKTSGTAIIHKNKVVITPETRDKKGLIYSSVPNPLQNQWMADLELHLGNDKQTHRGGTGVAIYYLKNIDAMQAKESIFGYTNTFEGLGIFINTIMVTSKDDRFQNPIQGYFNNGTQSVNVFVNKEKICYREMRNLPADQYFKLRIQYQKPFATVSFFNQQTYQYEVCFVLEAALEFNGFFAISGASGIQIPDHIYLKSFKLFNLMEYTTGEHFIEARRKKAEYEKLDVALVKSAKDLIFGKSKSDAKQDHTNLNELFTKIPLVHNHLSHQFQKAKEKQDAYIDQFNEILRTNLPNSTFFNEQQSQVESLQITLQNLSQSLDNYTFEMAAFEREVKKAKLGKPTPKVTLTKKEVNNKEIERLRSSIGSLQKKNEDLTQQLERLNQATLKMVEKMRDYDFDAELAEDTNRKQMLIEVSDIDNIFDELEQLSVGGSNSYIQMMVNLGMFGVMIYCGIIWMRLKQLAKPYD